MEIDPSRYKPAEKAAGDPRSERDTFVRKFTAKLNVYRAQDNLPLYTFKDVALKISHIPTEDLHFFYRQCEQANHFSKFFHWAIKVPKQ